MQLERSSSTVDFILFYTAKNVNGLYNNVMHCFEISHLEIYTVIQSSVSRQMHRLPFPMLLRTRSGAVRLSTADRQRLRTEPFGMMANESSTSQVEGSSGGGGGGGRSVNRPREKD